VQGPLGTGVLVVPAPELLPTDRGRASLGILGVPVALAGRAPLTTLRWMLLASDPALVFGEHAEDEVNPLLYVA
jgi:hypothetical protein